MKVLVCGSRDFEDSIIMDKVLREIEDAKETSISMIIHGAAPGADSLAGDWASTNCIPCLRVPANWGLYKKAAGPIRNSQMLTYEPDLVVAFPFEGSIGTYDMIVKAEKKGIEVKIIE